MYRYYTKNRVQWKIFLSPVFCKQNIPLQTLTTHFHTPILSVYLHEDEGFVNARRLGGTDRALYYIRYLLDNNRFLKYSPTILFPFYSRFIVDPWLRGGTSSPFALRQFSNIIVCKALCRSYLLSLTPAELQALVIIITLRQATLPYL